MRRFATLLGITGLLALFPAAAMAGGVGLESCPRGLSPSKLDTASPAEMTEEKRPLKEQEGIVPIPAHVGGTTNNPVYNYVWGTTMEPDGLAGSSLLCGVKTDTGLSESQWIGFVIAAFVLGLLISILLIWFPPQSNRS